MYLVTVVPENPISPTFKYPAVNVSTKAEADRIAEYSELLISSFNLKAIVIIGHSK